MYFCYDNLWRLLATKKMTKSDLCQLTGMSSRTVAKLSKNQSVTTDTLAGICDALGCDLADIAELKGDRVVDSIYEAYLKWSTKRDENRYYTVVEFSCRDLLFTVYVTKRAANSRTVIKCTEEGAVSAERRYPVGISPVGEVEPLLEPSAIAKDKDCVTVLVITGKPDCIKGLDSGVVRSARSGCEGGGFYVMSMSAFKIFDFKK
ncbi:MAG: helix-turn-helix transcriptional regulator [Ruminococcaceae bacterium]|nr:helix-turn-helix transcriptional regulator [Oscillospiraceae bacterium]